MNYLANQFQKIFRSIMPIISLLIFISLLVVGVVVFSYVIVIGAIVGLVLFAIAYFRYKFQAVFHPKKPGQQQPKAGRIIEHQDDEDSK